MGRKRLIGLVAGVAMVVPLPVTALEGEIEAPVVSEVGADAGTAGADDQVTVPIPGVGEVSAGGSVDPDARAGSVHIGVEAAVPGAPVSTDVDVTVGGSPDAGLEVDAAAPTQVGPVEGDPVADVVAPLVDQVDHVAPGVVPDVRPADPAPAAPAGEPAGQHVRASALPDGGVQAHDGPLSTASVVRVRSRAAAPAAAPATAVEVNTEPVAVAAPAARAASAPLLPEPGTSSVWLRLLAALMVAGTAITNRVVASQQD